MSSYFLFNYDIIYPIAGPSLTNVYNFEKLPEEQLRSLKKRNQAIQMENDSKVKSILMGGVKNSNAN